MNQPRVLALDLSLTATGYALPNGTLGTIHPTHKGDHRLLELHNQIDTLLTTHQPTHVLIEGPFVHGPSTLPIGMVHGATRIALLHHNTPYTLIPPTTLKVYATGKGTATKADMRVALLQRTGIDQRDDNQVDAAWLRHLGLDLHGTPQLALPATHRRALNKLRTLGHKAAADVTVHGTNDKGQHHG